MSVRLARPRAEKAPAARLALAGTLLVHLPTRGTPDALRIAVGLAERSGARLIGIAAEALDPGLYAGQPYMRGSIVSQWVDALDDRIADTRFTFEAETAPLGDRASWRSAMDIPESAVARLAGAADWLIAVRPAEDESANLAPPIAELILRTGLPVLLAPRDAAPLQARRIVVGWNDTREAARAIADAMPLLLAAEQVTVVSVRSGRLDETDHTRLEDVVLRLRHRGCKAIGERQDRGATSIAHCLAESARAYGADLVVVGGYAHCRVQEWIAGGVTQELISQFPAYVLFSH